MRLDAVSPHDNAVVPAQRPDPGLGGMRIGTRGKCRGILPALNPAFSVEMQAFADDGTASRGADILGLERAHVVFRRINRIAHVHDDHVPVGLVEHGRSLGFGGRIGLAPVHLDFLAGIAPDQRNADPDAGLPGGRVPLLDLVGQRLAIRREADIVAFGICLAEIKIPPVQPHQQGKVLFRRRGGQIRPLGRGQDVERARMLPARVLGRSRLQEQRKQGRAQQDWFHHGCCPCSR